jgi:hypothetical protein
MADYLCSSGSYSGEIYVQFYNDDGDRDVQIDYISVDGDYRQAEDQSYNTGVWQDGSCGGSYSEWLHCNGSIGFGEVSGGGGCDPTPITPYISVNDGSWQQISSVTVSSGTKVELGPQPSSGGSWNWSGCGTSGTSREQTIYPTSSCTATAAYTNDCGAQSTQNFNITVSGGGGGTTEAWLEAECGNVGSLWNVNSDGNASNDQYVTIQSGYNSTGSAPTSTSGHITYNFDLSNSGTYNLWARVITPSPTDDSFWLRMDGGSWYQWNNIGPASSWSWQQSQSYSLNSGSHTLTVAYREDGAQLDKIYVGNSTPSGEGSAASNCGGGGGGDNTIVVRARGNTGNESIELQLNDNTVQTWNVTTSYQSFTYTTSSASANIKVYFSDAGGGSNDVQIDYIQVNGQTFQAENQATNTGVWQDGGCGGSYSEWIHCAGYIDFGTRTLGKAAAEEFVEPVTRVPADFELEQNSPNPFNPTTNISFSIPENALVILKVYNTLGEEIQELVRREYTAGRHTVRFNASNLPSGVYFYTFRAGHISISKKMLLVR